MALHSKVRHTFLLSLSWCWIYTNILRVPLVSSFSKSCSQVLHRKEILSAVFSMYYVHPRRQTSEFLVSSEICIQLPIWTSANSHIERFNHKFGFYSTRKWGFYLYSFLFQHFVILKLCSLLINTQRLKVYTTFSLKN